MWRVMHASFVGLLEESGPCKQNIWLLIIELFIDSLLCVLMLIL